MAVTRFQTVFAAVALWGASALGQQPSGPVIAVNYPGSNANRYMELPLSQLAQHGVTLGERGSSADMQGLLLSSFLDIAGWTNVPEEKWPRYVVRVDGERAATLPLADALRRSLDNRAWVITGARGATPAGTDIPLVAVIGPGDAATLEVSRVQRITVVNTTEQRLEPNAEFERLTAYRSDGDARIVWREYVDADGVSVMIVTCYSPGRHEKSAVLLSEQVSNWTGRRVIDLLTAHAALRVDPNAAIRRDGTFTVVSRVEGN